MKKLFLACCIFFTGAFVMSCSDANEKPDIPDYVIPREKFVKVLVDLSLSESASNLNIKNLPTIKFHSAYAFNPLKENNVTKAQYDTTLAFYSRHPEMFREIYDDVMADLSRLQTEREKVQPADTSAVKKQTGP